MDIQEVETWVPVSQQWLDDAPLMRWQFEASMQSRDPETDAERESGWRTFTSSEGFTGQIAVGWRLEQMQREAEAEREAEMAACSYVECTCGHHNED